MIYTSKRKTLIFYNDMLLEINAEVESVC